MRVAGFGMNSRATADSLAAALAAAGSVDALAALASHAARVESLARTLGLPLIPVASVAGIATPTRSPRSLAAHATGSVAEAVALTAAGSGARITVPRVAAPDGNATCAVALSPDSPDSQASGKRSGGLFPASQGPASPWSRRDGGRAP